MLPYKDDEAPKRVYGRKKKESSEKINKRCFSLSQY
jgi:hypothetical protein